MLLNVKKFFSLLYVIVSRIMTGSGLLVRIIKHQTVNCDAHLQTSQLSKESTKTVMETIKLAALKMEGVALLMGKLECTSHNSLWISVWGRQGRTRGNDE